MGGRFRGGWPWTGGGAGRARLLGSPWSGGLDAAARRSRWRAASIARWRPQKSRVSAGQGQRRHSPAARRASLRASAAALFISRWRWQCFEVTASAPHTWHAPRAEASRGHAAHSDAALGAVPWPQAQPSSGRVESPAARDAVEPVIVRADEQPTVAAAAHDQTFSVAASADRWHR